MARRGRIPRPWHRAGTDSWYVTLDGKQVPLGKTKRESHAEFARLMAARGQAIAGGGRITVRELASLWLDERERRLSPRTISTYRSHIGSFVEACGGLQVRDLKPYHVTQWLAGKTLSQSTRHIAITTVKLLARWGEDQGYLDADPIRRLKRPGITRRAPITIEEAEAIMATVSLPVRVALGVLLVTGIRPGELCSLTAARIDAAARRATVKGKSGERIVPLSDAAIAILEPLTREHPVGPILLARQGPISVGTLDKAISRARPPACRILGRPETGCDHVTPHCFRGLFATEAMRQGVDSSLVSMILGHRDPAILMKHYAAPDQEMLRDAANRATRRTGSSGDTPPDPPR